MSIITRKFIPQKLFQFWLKHIYKVTDIIFNAGVKFLKHEKKRRIWNKRQSLLFSPSDYRKRVSASCFFHLSSFFFGHQYHTTI